MQSLNYLELMQIETWRLQQPAIPFDKKTNQYFYLLGTNAALFASVDLGTAEENDLLEKIVGALNFRYEKRPQSKYDLTILPPFVRVIIFLGDCASDFFKRPVKLHQLVEVGEYFVIATHSLQAMLEVKALKKEVWRDLQAALRAIKN